jgi:hypothetical protein
MIPCSGRNEARGSPADRKASAAEALMAFSLQFDLCDLRRSNSSRGICPPEATSILLAKTAKGQDGRRGRPNPRVNRTLDSAVGWGTFQSTPPYPSRQFAFFVSNSKATQSASSPDKHRGTREETPSSWQLDVLGNVPDYSAGLAPSGRSRSWSGWPASSARPASALLGRWRPIPP